MPGQRIHIIGIGGSGASGLARYLHSIGFEVSGSDIERDRTVALKQLGLKIADSHSATNIESPDLVLISPGVFAADKELAAAKRKNTPVLSWQEFMGKYLTRRPGKGFMVAGTFGKGSTAAILTHILEAAYLNPLAILGVEDVSWKSNLQAGFGDFWVLEADEYNRHFHHFHPSYALLTSLEHEHLSTYPTFDDYLAGFATFFQGMAEPKVVVVKRTPAIDAAQNKLLPTGGAITFSMTEEADVRGKLLKSDLSGSLFEVTAPRFNLAVRQFHLPVPGWIHVENAVGAMALSLAAGISENALPAGLATFRGLRQRFEVVQTGPYVTIYDYAHTPDRISPLIAQARQLFPGRRVIVLFEPHLYSRTLQFREEFTKVLLEADRSYITDIHPSREALSDLGKSIHSKDLTVNAGEKIVYAGTRDQGVELVLKNRTERDVVLVVGAGPIQYAAARLAH
ncbi:MAG: hypothetical protein HY420_00575 [Candidatus Kerfeldbacteria bacterium]|nr:hypothetical protein [Candidatus Kerfeldbacteria bacterium]